MDASKHDVILSARNFDLTDALKTLVHEKTEKLYQHESHIIRIRVELEATGPKGDATGYLAKGLIEIKGPTLVSQAESEDLYKSVDLLVQKLDRLLRRRSRLHRTKRKETGPVDIPAELPKVGTSG